MLLLCVMILSCVLFPGYWTLSTSKMSGFEHSKRSAFDIMPTRNTDYLKLKQSITARVFCTCQESDGECGRDQNLGCRTILNILPAKHSSHSRNRKMHRRRHLRKWIAKWFEQKKSFKSNIATE